MSSDSRQEGLPDDVADTPARRRRKLYAEMSREANMYAAFANCDLCEGKRHLVRSVSKRWLNDARGRSIATWAFTKMTGEIPDCDVCRADVCHYFILSMRNGEELCHKHSCEETGCRNFQLGSRMFLTTPSFGESSTVIFTPPDDLKQNGYTEESERDMWISKNTFPTEDVASCSGVQLLRRPQNN